MDTDYTDAEWAETIEYRTAERIAKGKPARADETLTAAVQSVLAAAPRRQREEASDAA